MTLSVPEDKAAAVFKEMFLQGSPAQIDAQIRKLDTGRSILDTIAGQAKDLESSVGPRDRERPSASDRPARW